MIDITLLTPEQLDKFIHLQGIIARQEEEAAKVKAARDYYSGNHPVLLTQRQQEYLGKQLTDGDFAFNHNLVKTVVDTLRERLAVTGFTVNGKSADDLDAENPDPDAQVAALLWQWWKYNRMDSQQIRLYRRTLRDGKSYVMVDYDNTHQRPRLSLHEVDDGTTGVNLHRNPEDENQVLFASRYFYTFNPLKSGVTGIQRKTVYLPGEIRKYERDSITNMIGIDNLWRPILDDGDLSWPIAWRDAQGNNLGVAAVEFQNPGGSEVALIAGLQNALNKSWLDLLAAADTAGFPILTMNYKDPMPMPMGVADDTNLEGDDEFIVAPGRALEIFGGNIERIPGADLNNIIEAIWTIAAAIGGMTRTPQYYLKPILGVDVPSGEALKQLESGLVAKAEERQLVFGEAWADVMSLAYRVARTFGNVPEIDEPVIGVQWKDASTRIEETEAKVAQTHKDLGVPDEMVWAKLGYTPEQIALFKQNAMLQRAAEIANIVQAARQPTTGTANQQQGDINANVS